MGESSRFKGRRMGLGYRHCVLLPHSTALSYYRPLHLAAVTLQLLVSTLALFVCACALCSLP